MTQRSTINSISRYAIVYACLAFSLASAAGSAAMAQQAEPAQAEPAQVVAVAVAQVQAPDADAGKDVIERVRVRERDYLLRVCKLTEEQTRELNTVGDKVKAELTKKADNPGAGVIIGRLIPQLQIAAPDNGQLDANKMLQLHKSFQHKYIEVLKPEQKEAYEAELKARVEFKKRANAEVLLQIIDHKVALTPEQIEPLRESLKEWTGAGDLHLMYYMTNGSENYFPPIPKRYYNKLLTQAQLEILSSVQEVSIQRGVVGEDDANLIW